MNRSTLTQSRYLHYEPGPEKLKRSVKEPQELTDFWKYRYHPGEIAEVAFEAQYFENDPYLLHSFYDWENITPKHYNDWFSYGNLWVWFFFGGIYVWISLLFLVGEWSKPKEMDLYRSTDISGGLELLCNNQHLLHN